MRCAASSIAPGDAAYDEARSVWNGMIDRRPALIARCAGTERRDRGDRLRAQRGTDRRGARRRPQRGRQRHLRRRPGDRPLADEGHPGRPRRRAPSGPRAASPGASSTRETQALGLATTGGLVTTTGIAGFTLGGGIGWLMRKHGLACDNLISADVVTADGQTVRASETENAELLWGLRGGGGNFGVVTRVRVPPASASRR